MSELPSICPVNSCRKDTTVRQFRCKGMALCPYGFNPDGTKIAVVGTPIPQPRKSRKSKNYQINKSRRYHEAKLNKKVEF